jgi:4-carboxymuconolactone decarboxylase
MKFLKIFLIAVAVIATCGQIKSQTKMVLNNRQQGLVAIAALEAKGDVANLKVAINDGLDNGLTVNEIKEALSQLYAYTGFPRSLNSLGVLQEVVKERNDKGVKSVEGKDADPLPENYNALKQGTEVQTKLSGRPFNYAFSPAADYYLKAHLFGDIFARNILSFADRELVTVSAISSLEGCEPQLIAHVQGARNMGVKDGELHSIPEVLEKKVGLAEAHRASVAIAKVFNEPRVKEAAMDKPFYPVGDFNSAYAKYFIGNSYLYVLATGEGKLPIVNVTFEPGCRNNWHTHYKGGQILICVAGRGWYQEWGKAPRELHVGDVVDIPAGVKHWHGAAKDCWFQHIAIGVPAEGASTEWLEPVTDEAYNKLP